MEALDGNRWGEVVFRDRGRHFYIFIWVGRHATKTQVGLLLRALDGIQIDTLRRALAEAVTGREASAAGPCARELLLELRNALAQIGVFLDQPRKLTLDQIEERIDLVLVVTALADRRFTERDVMHVGGR